MYTYSAMQKKFITLELFHILAPQCQVFCNSNSFSSKIALNLAPSILPSTLTIFPVPAKEKRHMFAVSLTWLLASVNGTYCGFH